MHQSRNTIKLKFLLKKLINQWVVQLINGEAGEAWGATHIVLNNKVLCWAQHNIVMFILPRIFLGDLLILVNANLEI